MIMREIVLKAIDCERLGFTVAFVNGHKEKEAKANAHLINASKDLLEAMIDAEKKIVAMFDAISKGSGEDFAKNDPDVLKIRKAIAKATGA